MQNINTVSNSATYVRSGQDNVVIYEGLQGQPPIPCRDGEPSEFPFYSEESQTFQANDKIIEVTAEDDPYTTWPLELKSASKKKWNGTLSRTDGGIYFNIWFALAREASEKATHSQPCIVLLGVQSWRQLTTTVSGPNGFSLPPPLVVDPVRSIAPPTVYRAYVQSSTTVPDLREDAIANEQGFFEFRYPGEKEAIKWITGENHPEEFEDKSDIKTVPNFFKKK